MLWVFKVLPLCFLCILWQILTFYDIIKIDDLVRSQFFTQRHKGTKKGLLKIFMFFFVSSVISV